MKRNRQGRFTKEPVSSMNYAEEYYNKYEKKIKRAYPDVEDLADFKAKVEFDMFAPKTFSSKRVAKQKMDDALYRAAGGDLEALKAKREAWNINGRNYFSKVQQLNKKIGDFVDITETSISDTETVVGYYELKNEEDIIIGKVRIQEPGQSPYEVYKFINRRDIM